jgi:hypothetical protein
LRAPLALRPLVALRAVAILRAELFLRTLLAVDFARAGLFFLVAAALRLAIAVVLSATGLP